MEDQFIRTQMLLGSDGLSRLQRSHVAVFGLGGVGSWCAEALCRSGVGELTLIDQDEFVLPMLPPGGSMDDIITSKNQEV